jgi:hypothetical protein
MQRPIHEIRQGLITAKIYGRKLGGRLKFTVSLTRVFRNGEVWNESSRLGTENLLTASWLLTQAYRWIHAREAGDDR